LSESSTAAFVLAYAQVEIEVDVDVDFEMAPRLALEERRKRL
jgi:hypothetical protein